MNTQLKSLIEKLNAALVGKGLHLLKDQGFGTEQKFGGFKKCRINVKKFNLDGEVAKFPYLTGATIDVEECENKKGDNLTVEVGVFKNYSINKEPVKVFRVRTTDSDKRIERVVNELVGIYTA